MWFDVHTALAEIDHAQPALQSRVAHVANVVRLPASKSGSSSTGVARDEAAVLEAIESGRLRPGAIATATGLGATVTYELLDRLQARGRLVITRDGEWRFNDGAGNDP